MLFRYLQKWGAVVSALFLLIQAAVPSLPFAQAATVFAVDSTVSSNAGPATYTQIAVDATTEKIFVVSRVSGAAFMLHRFATSPDLAEESTLNFGNNNDEWPAIAVDTDPSNRLGYIAYSDGNDGGKLAIRTLNLDTGSLTGDSFTDLSTGGVNSVQVMVVGNSVIVALTDNDTAGQLDLFKFDKSDLNATPDYLQVMLDSPGGISMTNDGTFGYVALDQGGNGIYAVKFNISTMALDTSLGPLVTSSNSSETGSAIVGDYLYIGYRDDNSTPSTAAAIIKVNKNTFTAQEAGSPWRDLSAQATSYLSLTAGTNSLYMTYFSGNTALSALKLNPAMSTVVDPVVSEITVTTDAVSGQTSSLVYDGTIYSSFPNQTQSNQTYVAAINDGIQPVLNANSGTAANQNAVNISRTDALTLSYDETLDGFSASDIRVHGTLSGQIIPTSVTGQGASTIQFNHNGFQAGEMISVFLPPGFTAQGGELQNNNFQMQFVTATSGGSGAFASPQAIQAITGGYNAVVAGDVDGDGDIDLAATHGSSNQVTVFTNDGSGTFTAGTPITVGSTPTKLVIADFDNDANGSPDIAVLNQGDESVTILTNDGSGNFTAGTAISVLATGSREIGYSDTDLDGDLDLIVIFTGTLDSNQNGGYTELTNANGSFSAQVATSQLFNPLSAFAADSDNDGDIVDFILVDSTFAFLFEKTGPDSAESAGQITGLTSNTTEIQLMQDLNEDGNTDALLINPTDNFGGSDLSTINILAGDGTAGGYTLGSAITVGNRPVSAVAADIDSDSALEILVANQTDSSVSILNASQGNLDFSTTSTLSLSGSPNDLAAADFDGDGKIDVLAATDAGFELALLTDTPGVPTSVTAVAGPENAEVSFTAPTDDGNSTITQYTVTSTPGNIQATGTASPITITGLTAEETYTFTVTATNAVGTSSASTASNQIEAEVAPVQTSGRSRSLVRDASGAAKDSSRFTLNTDSIATASDEEGKETKEILSVTKISPLKEEKVTTTSRMLPSAPESIFTEQPTTLLQDLLSTAISESNTNQDIHDAEELYNSMLKYERRITRLERLAETSSRKNHTRSELLRELREKYDRDLERLRGATDK